MTSNLKNVKNPLKWRFPNFDVFKLDVVKYLKRQTSFQIFTFSNTFLNFDVFWRIQGWLCDKWHFGVFKPWRLWWTSGTVVCFLTWIQLPVICRHMKGTDTMEDSNTCWYVSAPWTTFHHYQHPTFCRTIWYYPTTIPYYPPLSITGFLNRM